MSILKASFEKSVEWTRQRNPRKAPSEVKVPHTIIAIVYKGVYVISLRFRDNFGIYIIITLDLCPSGTLQIQLEQQVVIQYLNNSVWS